MQADKKAEQKLRENRETRKKAEIKQPKQQLLSCVLFKNEHRRTKLISRKESTAQVKIEP